MPVHPRRCRTTTHWHPPSNAEDHRGLTPPNPTLRPTTGKHENTHSDVSIHSHPLQLSMYFFSLHFYFGNATLTDVSILVGVWQA